MIHIDPITVSSVYRALGPQGLWHWHRFGRRPYPGLMLDYGAPITHSLDHDIVFESHYGDPMAWPYIYDATTKLIGSGNHVTIVTHGSSGAPTALEELAKLDINIVLKIDGVENSGKVYLGSNPEHNRLIMRLFGSRCTVVAETYGHNQSDSYDQLRDSYGCTVIEMPGFVYGDWLSPVVNEEGEWLYDIRNNCEPDLRKTTIGHSMLRYHVKPANHGNNLNETPALPKRFAQYAQPVKEVDLYISADGKLHPDRAHWENWSNHLAGDYNAHVIDVDKLHERETAGILYKYGQIDDSQLDVGYAQSQILESAAWRYLTDPTVS